MKFIIALLGCLIPAPLVEGNSNEMKQASILKKISLTPENNHKTDSSILDRTESLQNSKIIKPIFRSATTMSTSKIFDDKTKSHKNLAYTLECDCDTKEYVFLSNTFGNVMIIDANTYEIIRTDQRPEISHSIIAITDGVLYNIDTLNGTILSTGIRDMISEGTVNWRRVGSFPQEEDWIRNSAVVHGSNIFFVTRSGLFYKYDRILRTVTQEGIIVGTDYNYASLVVVNDMVYIYKDRNFYSFDGSIVKQLNQTESEFGLGLFKLGNTICAVGELDKEATISHVNCYDPKNQKWSISSYINTGRTFPAIARTQSGTCVFGGYRRYSNATEVYSAEILNYETREWTYIPIPPLNSVNYLQAVTFSL